MTKADRVHSTPPLNTSASLAEQVGHELFDLEDQFLRVRGHIYAVRMLASSPDVGKEATDAIEALKDTILEEIDGLIEERTRLCRLASGREEGGENAEG
jgi:hypothetical protein